MWLAVLLLAGLVVSVAGVVLVRGSTPPWLGGKASEAPTGPVGSPRVPAPVERVVAGLPAPTDPAPTLTPLPTIAPTPPEQPPLQLVGAFPRNGPGTFTVEPTRGPVLGAAGPIRRFQVAVERGMAEGTAEFAAAIDDVLGDPRSWVAGRRFRLQRAAAGAAHDFTVYLATPGTAQRLCRQGGVDIRVNGEPFTSCRAGPAVVINLARWRLATPSYVSRRIPLAVYRQYVINHEVGHALGHGHARCPGPGRPAPVMMQQTLSLGRCTANPWPYLNGRQYSGPSL